MEIFDDRRIDHHNRGRPFLHVFSLLHDLLILWVPPEHHRPDPQPEGCCLRYHHRSAGHALFAMTGAIASFLMPEIMSSGTPILLICQQYLPTVLTAIYWWSWFAVVSTAPASSFNFSNRWATVRKTEKLSHKATPFSPYGLFADLLLADFSVGSWPLSRRGKAKCWATWALFAAVVIPLYSIYRVWKKNIAVWEENVSEA